MAASKLSAVHRGTAFERRSLELLQAHFSMALRRVGGRSDGGVDLVGWWWLPFASEIHRPGALPDPNGLLRRRMRILAQCKAEKKKFSPKYVREMEGVWHLHSRPSASPAANSPSPSPPSENTAPDVCPTVALLLSESPFSQSTILHAYRTTTKAIDPELGTVCPNPSLTHLVRPLAFCWERNPSAGPKPEIDAHIGGRPGVWWQGRKLRSWAPESPDLDAT